MTAVATCAIDEAPSRCSTTNTFEHDAVGNDDYHTGSTPNNYLYCGEQTGASCGHVVILQCQ